MLANKSINLVIVKTLQIFFIQLRNTHSFDTMLTNPIFFLNIFEAFPTLILMYVMYDLIIIY